MLLFFRLAKKQKKLSFFKKKLFLLFFFFYFTDSLKPFLTNYRWRKFNSLFYIVNSFSTQICTNIFFANSPHFTLFPFKTSIFFQTFSLSPSPHIICSPILFWSLVVCQNRQLIPTSFHLFNGFPSHWLSHSLVISHPLPSLVGHLICSVEVLWVSQYSVWLA